MSSRIFKIGTRTSLLAWRQSEMVRDLIQRNVPDATVELHGIQTRGDQIQDRPLTELEGKDFFVAELDRALLNQVTDITVHSLKDLSTERSDELRIAAVPPRYAPHDVIIFAPGVFANGNLTNHLTVGTGSPRRKACIEAFLPALLPHQNSRPKVVCQPIRGNVDTRLKRLREPSQRFPQVDAVVLALAGLERLWANPKTRAPLEPLLQGTRMMVLPLPLFPTAPGQAALAIECRADDLETIQLLQPLHCETTASAVHGERTLLSALGGGCHLPLGATALPDDRFASFMWTTAPDASGRIQGELQWAPKTPLPPLPETVRPVDGVAAKPEGNCSKAVLASELPPEAYVFVSHRRALPESIIRSPMDRRFWVPGVETWQKLAAEGLFVSGSTDGMGWHRMPALAANTLLELPQDSGWHVLTNDRASGWSNCAARVQGTYTSEIQDDLQFETALQSATHVYWGSPLQFERYRDFCPDEVHHASGPGRTAERLAAAGLTHYTVFPSRKSWQLWVEPSENSANKGEAS